jgi:hypothetical protein
MIRTTSIRTHSGSSSWRLPLPRWLSW